MENTKEYNSLIEFILDDNPKKPANPNIANQYETGQLFKNKEGKMCQYWGLREIIKKLDNIDNGLDLSFNILKEEDGGPIKENIKKLIIEALTKLDSAKNQHNNKSFSWKDNNSEVFKVAYLWKYLHRFIRSHPNTMRFLNKIYGKQKVIDLICDIINNQNYTMDDFTYIYSL
jgi:hypothetical protein